jgi:Cdc6-like AAA superfamily ATPase
MHRGGDDDPDWVPTLSSSAPTTSSYSLRPRKPKVEQVESDSETMDDNDLVITISQMKRTTNPKNEIVPSVVIRNEDLPSIPFTINSFDDLYRLASAMESTSIMYKDCQRMKTLYPVLQELNAMVGLRSTKDALCNFILFELQNMPSYWRHMVITGAPGVGKTSIANIIAKLLNKLGRTPSDEIVRGNPLNMISDYEGQTKSRVNKVVQEALSKSGVLLIDEAPSLNDKQNRDSYGKKCLDMLMQLMDSHRERLIVIFAGYKEEMETNILQSNPGFRRRIQWFFHMQDYSDAELYEIFLQKIGETQFKIQTNTKFNKSWFIENYKKFPYFGGSVENFVHKIRTVHTRKIFGFGEKNMLSDETMEEAFHMYIQFTVEPMKPKTPIIPSVMNYIPFSMVHNRPYMYANPQKVTSEDCFMEEKQ